MTSDEKLVLETSDLKIGYSGNGRGSTVVSENINETLRSGEVIGLLGPNGSGKSTLIRTLSGLHQPLGGEIELFGRNLAHLNPKDIAKRLSTVLTDRITIGNLPVYSLVAFGRSPYTGMLGRLTREDEKVVQWALTATGMQHFADRDIQKLSDGERQKVMIARALAQDTSVILLDEPTAHLDLPNRVEIIRLLRKLAHETGKGILLSTHELDLALKAADRIWLMNNDRRLESGVPEDLVLDGTFERVFDRDSFDFDRQTGSFKIHREDGDEVALSGDPVPRFWTARALKREGYTVVEKGKEGGMQVRVTEEDKGWTWTVAGCDRNFGSMAELIDHLRDSE